MNSVFPVAAFSCLKESLDANHLSDFAYLLQKEFFLKGNSLERLDTYPPILKHFNLYTPDFVKSISKALENATEYNKDFLETQNLGVGFYPTVIAEINNPLILEKMQEQYLILKKLIKN